MNNLNTIKIGDVITFLILAAIPGTLGYFWYQSILQSVTIKDYLAASIIFGPLTIMFLCGLVVQWEQRHHDTFKLVHESNGDWVIYYNYRGQWGEHKRAKTEAAVIKKHNEWVENRCRVRASMPLIKP